MRYSLQNVKFIFFIRSFKCNMNENTYNSLNEMRFPISFGIFPVILFADKYLNNCKKNKKY